MTLVLYLIVLKNMIVLILLFPILTESALYFKLT